MKKLAAVYSGPNLTRPYRDDTTLADLMQDAGYATGPSQQWADEVERDRIRRIEGEAKP